MPTISPLPHKTCLGSPVWRRDTATHTCIMVHIIQTGKQLLTRVQPPMHGFQRCFLAQRVIPPKVCGRLRMEEPHKWGRSTPSGRLAAGPYSAISTQMLMSGKELGLGINVSLAARFRVACRSETLAEGLAKIQAARSGPL